VGANERTAKYVGGGALFGTLLGALAGGGKGAAIGAAAGGAAGAGAQTVTRGKSVNVPSETVLTFRLDEPLRVAVDPYTEDRGYDDNGNHYHNNYYRRDNRR
jgi:outer membrane lipoprotein SlyB